MFVAIHHSITDPKKWEEAGNKIFPMVEQGRLPKGLKALSYLPSTDGRKADCLWEADSLDNLKKFLDPLTNPAARNEYIPISTEHSFGLPVSKTEPVAAH